MRIHENIISGRQNTQAHTMKFIIILWYSLQKGVVGCRCSNAQNIVKAMSYSSDGTMQDMQSA